MKILSILLTILVVIAFGGCTPSLRVSTNSPTSITPTNNPLRQELTQIPASRPAGDSIQPINTPDNIGMTPSPASTNQFVNLVTHDLANRLNIGIDQITFLKIIDIDWQDITQGCTPTPGQSLIKGKLSGYRIWLEANSKDYVYQVSLDGRIYLCPD